MRTTIALLLTCFQLACATQQRPTPITPVPVGSTALLLDGGVCELGDDTNSTAHLTPPSLDRRVLTTGLAPGGHPGGQVIVKCRVTAIGELHDCVSLNDEAGLASSVILRLRSMRATPATCKGQPISLDYVINLRFEPR